MVKTAERRDVPDSPISRVKIIAVEFSLIQQGSTGCAPIVIIAETADLHDEFPDTRN